MKRFRLPFVVALSVGMLAAACGPTAPAPAVPTRPIASVSTPVQAIAPATPTALPTAYPTLPGGCTPPANWTPYAIRSGDTLYTLAQQSQVTPGEVMSANCLASTLIKPGQIIYLPLAQCTQAPLEGWENYVVRGGDTLFSLAITHDTTVDDVKHANCLVSDALRTGQNLYLPPLKQLPPTPAGCTGPGCTASGASGVVSNPAPPQPCDPFVCGASPDANPLLVFTPGIIFHDFFPCDSFFGTTPRIEIRVNGPNRNELELGEPIYLYACYYPIPPTTAIITMSNGLTQLLTPAASAPPPQSSDSGTAFAWAAEPTVPIGGYEFDTVGVPSVGPSQFTVTVPSREHILVLPAFGSPGTTFQIYYVNFLKDIAKIDFYAEDPTLLITSTRGVTQTFTLRRSDLVGIDGQFTQPELSSSTDRGWGAAPFLTASDYPTGTYAATYNDKSVKTFFRLR